MAKRGRNARRKNPFLKGQTIKGADIPKKNKKGDCFVRGGVKYLVISYTTRTGKRVRYARPIRTTRLCSAGW